MTDEEILQAEASHIVKILNTEGFSNIMKWIDGRIDLLRKRVISGETDISVESVTKSKANKVDVTIVNISKDYEKHELRVWELFKRKIKDWENAGGG